MKHLEIDSSKSLDMVLLGRVAVDLNPIDYYCTLAESMTFKKYLGGSPANIAVGMARLGMNIGFFGRVSADRFGDYVVDYFERESIDTSRIFRCENGEKIGLTFTEILSETQSSILMYRNEAADLKLEVSDIDEEYIKSAKVLLISGTALAESPSREAALKAVAIANKLGTPIVFDIDYRPYNWKNEDETAIYYSLVAQSASIILGSKEEFNLMSKFALSNPTDKEEAEYWFGKNAKIVIIKHGKEGSIAYTNDKKSYKVKPFPVKLLKSFGGGDGYASAFLTSLLKGKELTKCLEYASASAAMLVASHGCSADMPKDDALEEFTASAIEKYGSMVTDISEV